METPAETPDFWQSLQSHISQIFALPIMEQSVPFIAQIIAQIVLIFALLLLGRYIYDLITPFSLKEVLTTRDNKALAFSFTSYLSGLCIVIVGVYNSPSVALELPYWKFLLYSFSDTLLWGLLGICLLLLAQFTNDRWILSRFPNYEQIVKHRNLAAAIVEGSGYIASAILIYGVMQGVTQNFLLEIILTAFYFVLGQIALIFHSRIFIAAKAKKWASKKAGSKDFGWDFQKEIITQNSAAAISFAAGLLSFSWLLSFYIANFFSIYGLLLMMLFSTAWVLLLHWVIDKCFFPNVPLAKEISCDRNWGAALIQGALLIGFSALGTSIFSAYFAS